MGKKPIRPKPKKGAAEGKRSSKDPKIAKFERPLSTEISRRVLREPDLHFASETGAGRDSVKNLPEKGDAPVKPPPFKPGKQFPIVGIGASAGGLEALERFLGPIPENCGMAFVVIQHLDPNRKDIMPELLQRITRLKVLLAEDGLFVRPNTVFVIPPNKNMSILNGGLHLFDPVEPRGLRHPIDFFFRALADDKKNDSIGVILSGMGSDGSLGLKAIKEKGGVVLVQEPDTAKFDGMPRSALESVQADIIAPAEFLSGRLVSYLQRCPRTSVIPEMDENEKNALEKIIILLRTTTGNDFSSYKKNTIFRRVERRMNIHKISKIAAYVRFLQENSQEVAILFKEILIGVTNFFRDAQIWEFLKNEVLPRILSEVSAGTTLRAWVPGCATGEEAYSLAIVFKEAMEGNGPLTGVSLQIFATDLDLDAIEVARKGYYKNNIVTDVSADRLKRFFTQEDQGYKVNPEVRETIVFASQNVLMDPPFTKLDILSCRNLLIYMENILQKKLLSLFHFCLNPGGILLLGNAETVGHQGSLFKALDMKMRLYKSLARPAVSEIIDFPSNFSKGKEHTTERVKAKEAAEGLQGLANQLILKRFSPPTILVNEAGEILYVSGSTGKYLEPPTGRVNWNVFAMLREGLRTELQGTFRRAVRSDGPVALRNLKIEANGETQFVDVVVQRINQPKAMKGLVILAFYDVPKPEENAPGRKGERKWNSSLVEKELSLELQHARDELQKSLEDMQTSQEELKSTNEELQSTNEELQSTNEELTTSKEEMQSLNEELQAVNTELQNKVDEFSRVNNDMTNLLNSTDIATLFLDRDLNIRRFTTQATKIFKLIASDIGRPFTDQANVLDYPHLAGEANEVLQSLVPREKIIPSYNGQWFRMRIMPYRTADNRIDGLVITFIDITDRKIAETSLLERENEFKAVIRLMKNPFGLFEVVRSGGKIFSGRILFTNDAFEKLFKVTASQVEGRTLHEVCCDPDSDWEKIIEAVVGADKVQVFDKFFFPLGKNLHCFAYRPGPNPNRFCVIFEENPELEVRS